MQLARQVWLARLAGWLGKMAPKAPIHSTDHDDDGDSSRDINGDNEDDTDSADD